MTLTYAIKFKTTYPFESNVKQGMTLTVMQGDLRVY